MQGQISGTRREGQPCRWGQAGVPALLPTRRVTLGQAVGGAVPRSSARRTSLRGPGDRVTWDRAAPGLQREHSVSGQAETSPRGQLVWSCQLPGWH